MSNRQDFTEAYIEAALWSSTADNGDPLDNGNYSLAAETRTAMEREAGEFYDAHAETIENADCSRGSGEYSQAAQAGHDFWLTRCGHGAGFWDGDWTEPAATILDNASKAAGNRDLYVNESGEIFQC